VRAFVDAFAGRAYRRPLSAAELDSLNQEIADLSALGSDPQEIAQYGVYAVLMAPEFLYRTEFGGSSSSSDVALTPYEMATGAVSLRYRLNLLGEVVIDPVHVPEFSPALEDAMATESRMFLDEVMWHGQLGDLMTSTASFVNTDLATIVYGIPAPAGATATDFVRVELPADQRAGVLTRAAFLTELARTDIESLLGRGITVAERVACELVAPPSDAFAAEEYPIIQASAGWTQEAQARQRLALPDCTGCHAFMDPYGLTLGHYDIIGRMRTQDEQGRPVDSSAVLPPAYGNQPVADGVDLSRKIAANPTFTACLTQSFLHYGLSDLPTLAALPTLPAGPAPDSCVVQDIATRFAAAPDHTFARLLHEIIRSPAMTRRLRAQ